MKKSDRNLIYQKFDGRCAYCGCELPKNWHVDEIEPVQRGWRYKPDPENKLGYYLQDEFGRPIKETYMLHPERLNINNQFPACPSCNINKHSGSVESFRALIQGFINSLNSYSVQYRLAKKYGLIEETEKKVTFYFETYANSISINPDRKEETQM
jgi:hypothetical protein